MVDLDRPVTSVTFGKRKNLEESVILGTLDLCANLGRKASKVLSGEICDGNHLMLITGPVDEGTVNVQNAVIAAIAFLQKCACHEQYQEQSTGSP